MKKFLYQGYQYNSVAFRNMSYSKRSRQEAFPENEESEEYPLAFPENEDSEEYPLAFPDDEDSEEYPLAFPDDEDSEEYPLEEEYKTSRSEECFRRREEEDRNDAEDNYQYQKQLGRLSEISNVYDEDLDYVALLSMLTNNLSFKNIIGRLNNQENRKIMEFLTVYHSFLKSNHLQNLDENKDSKEIVSEILEEIYACVTALLQTVQNFRSVEEKWEKLIHFQTRVKPDQPFSIIMETWKEKYFPAEGSIAGWKILVERFLRNKHLIPKKNFNLQDCREWIRDVNMFRGCYQVAGLLSIEEESSVRLFFSPKDENIYITTAEEVNVETFLLIDEEIHHVPERGYPLFKPRKDIKLTRDYQTLKGADFHYFGSFRFSPIPHGLKEINQDFTDHKDYKICINQRGQILIKKKTVEMFQISTFADTTQYFGQ